MAVAISLDRQVEFDDPLEVVATFDLETIRDALDHVVETCNAAMAFEAERLLSRIHAILNERAIKKG